MRRMFPVLAASCLWSLLAFASGPLHAQAVDTVVFTPLGEHAFSGTWSGWTPLIDRANRPYVYLAAKELGLVVFDITDPTMPAPVDTLSVDDFGGLKATGVDQDGQTLFVSLGDFQGPGSPAGLAAVDVSNPSALSIIDQWDSTAFAKGTSSVVLSDGHAFLSAMAEGLLILDVSNPSALRFVAQLVPDPAFGSQSFEYHARGLHVEGGQVLIAHDNGGLRSIDIGNPAAPVEIGKYVNADIDNQGDAFYNHVHRIGNHAFVAMDFCGVEVVDISNPAAMAFSAWLDPWACTDDPPPFGSWNGSPGHTNEIAYDADKGVLFFSGGDSQVLALDPSTPLNPRFVGAFGETGDMVGSWGVDAHGGLVAIANLRTLGFPFVGTVGGLELIGYDVVLGEDETDALPLQLVLRPNPVRDRAILEWPVQIKPQVVSVLDLRGARVYGPVSAQGSQAALQLGFLPAGLYQVLLEGKDGAMLRAPLLRL